MKTLTLTALIGVASLATTLGACSTAPRTTQTASGTAFRGEVWTWDQPAQTVTLRQGNQTIRVRVSPDQFATLQLHQTTTVRGELVGPAEIATVPAPPQPMTVIPRGAPDQSDVAGTLTAIDPTGLVTIDSARGMLKVWTTVPVDSHFTVGAPVRVRISVQPVDMVPRAHVLAKTREATPSQESASVGSEPGDYATVTGRIISVDRSGSLTLESPRGPVTVWVPDTARYESGRSVQVKTSVHPAR